MKVTSISAITGGKEVTLDVFSDQAMTHQVYQGLIGITVLGTPINSSLSVGQKKFLLGFFSVNLKKALQEAQGTSSEANAVNVKGAVEFFIFGVASQGAVVSCN